MNDPTVQQIARVLRAARRRVRAWQGILALVLLLPIGAGLAVVELAFLQFVRVPRGTVALGNLVLAAGALGFLAWATLRRTALFQIAREIDARATIADRVASSLEFAALDSPREIHAAQVGDAARALAGVNVPSLFPFPKCPFGKRILAALAIAPLIYLVSVANLPSLLPGRTPQQKAEEEFARAKEQGGAPPLSEVGLSDERRRLASDRLEEIPVTAWTGGMVTVK